MVLLVVASNSDSYDSFRAGVSPFVSARSVLEPLKVKEGTDRQPDLLQLCRDVQLEVIQLKYPDKCVIYMYYNVCVCVIMYVSVVCLCVPMCVSSWQ